MKQLTLTVLLLMVGLGLRAQSLQLTWPNGGEVWLGGSVHNITWTYTNVDNIKIEYSLDNGLNWTIITSSYPSSALSYAWTVPCIGSNLAKIRITNTLLFTQDESNAVFTIPEPTVDITYPNGGESFNTGTGQYIEWLTTGVTTVKVQYTLNNGVTWTDIGNFPATNNYCNWIIPSTLSSQARIRALNIESTIDRDSSSSYFNIINSSTINNDKYKGGSLDGYNMCSNISDTIRVLTPNGGEVYSPTNTVALNWSFRHIDQIKIEYSIDNGSSWNLIVNDIPASQLSYNWTVPNAPSNQCRLKITSLRTGVFDISDAPFTINAAFVNVLYPNGNESFGTGTGQYIEWDYNSVATVKLEYSTNNGSTWTTIGTAPAADKYANWIPPTTISSQCLIRVSDNALPSVNDISNAAFTLFNLPIINLDKYKGGLYDGFSMNSNLPDTIRVTSPNGGELWTSASTRTITWTYNEVDNIAIELTKDDGLTWTTLAASVPASQLSYSWTIPTTPSYTCRIRLRDITRPIQDVSDAVFIIPNAYVQITYPNGGENFGATTGQYIEWDYSDLATIKLEYSVNNGNTWNVIGTAPAANKYANWVVPTTVSSQILIRATDIDNPIYTDNSNTVFSSYNLPTLDINKYKGGQFDGYSMFSYFDSYVKVIKPNGGEIWGNGSTQQIKWATLNNAENLKLEYSTDNEVTWTTLVSNIANNPVAYNWTISSPVSTICKVRATTMSGTLVDKSDDFFTIANPNGIITNPISGVSFCSGATTSVSFSNTINFNSGNHFIVQLSDSDGTFNGSLVNVGEIISTTPQAIPITFPPKYFTSSLYRLRVIGTNPPTIGTDNGTNLTINPLPLVNLGRDTTICNGNTLTLSAGNSGSTFIWSTGATNSSIVVNQAGVYWVDVTNNCGTSRDSIVVSVLQVPTVNLGPDRQICINSSTTLVADSGAYNYLWSTGSTNRSITVVVPGNYQVTSSNVCGTATDNINISNLPALVVNLGNNQGICNGQSITLNAGNTGATYLWSNGSANQSITVNQPGTYSVNVTNTCGTVSDQITLYNGSFQVNAGVDQAICFGSSTQIVATGANNYSWNTGQSTATINVSPNINSTYIVTATNVYGCSSSDTIVVNVNTLPLASIQSLSGSSTFCANQPTILTANSGIGLVYQWLNNGVVIPGANSISFSPSINGLYSVRTTNAQGCSNTSNVQNITVLDIPIASITPSGSLSICSGSSVTLNSSNVSGVTYNWFKDGLSIPGASSSSLLVAQGGNYTLQITNANNCTATSTATQVNVNAVPSIPTISAGGPTTFCQGGSVTLTSSSSSGNTWSNGATSQAITVVNSGVYSLTVSNGNCTATSSALTVNVIVSALGTVGSISGNNSICNAGDYTYSIPLVNNATNYTWTVPANASIISGQGTNTVIVRFSSSFVNGALSVVASNTCQSTIPSSINITLQNSGSIGTVGAITGTKNGVCAGSLKSYSITAVTNATNYTWVAPINSTITSGQGTTSIKIQFNSSFTSGTLSVSANNACVSSNTVSSAINSIPSAPGTITGPATNLCGSTAQYSISAVTGATTYTWSTVNGGTVSSGQGTRIAQVAWPSSSLSSASVCVTANNTCGSSIAKCKTGLTTLPLKPVTINGSTTVCANQTNITYSVAAEPGVSYVWGVPNGSSIVSGQGSATAIINWGTVSGSVRVTAYNQCGNQATKYQSITITCRENEFGNTVFIYPNPTKGLLTIESNEIINRIEIFDMLGKLVSVYGNEKQIDLSMMNNGLYLIRFTSENGVEQRRVEVSH